MKTHIATPAFAIIIMAAPAIQAAAMAKQYQKNLHHDSCSVITKAAQYLVDAQQANDGSKLGWSWKEGGTSISENISSITALGLLQAYHITKQPIYLMAAKDYGDSLLHKGQQWNRDNPPYKPDVEFLVALSKLTAHDPYYFLALDGHQHIKQRAPTGAEEVKRILEGRQHTPALLGFDVALAIRASQAVHDHAYARGLADAVLQLKDTWYIPKKDLRFSVLSAGAIAHALQILDAKQYHKSITQLQTELMRLQGQNGSWASNETQPTAYAVMALQQGDIEHQKIAQKGATWLRSTMLRQGRFAHYNDYMPEPFVGDVIPEVQAETIIALAFACPR